MASLKPVHWSYGGRDKTYCCPLRKHQGFKCRYFLNPSPPFVDHHINRINVSSKASLFHHDSSSQLHRTSTHHIHPFPKEEESMKEEESEEEDINPQKLDQWVKDSAVEVTRFLFFFLYRVDMLHMYSKLSPIFSAFNLTVRLNLIRLVCSPFCL